MDREVINQIRDVYIRRNVTSLFKSFLVILEDLEQDHLMFIDKLKKSLPEDCHKSVDDADYLDEEKVQYLRKKILDAGNSCIRNLE